MTATRKTASLRIKELRQALLSIEKGRAKSGVTKLSIASVAREAGVTPALIHNHYPTIAEEIRSRVEASTQKSHEAKRSDLGAERMKNKILRKQIEELERRIKSLASINEMLLMENQVRQLASGGSRVSRLP